MSDGFKPLELHSRSLVDEFNRKTHIHRQKKILLGEQKMAVNRSIKEIRRINKQTTTRAFKTLKTS